MANRKSIREWCFTPMTRPGRVSNLAGQQFGRLWCLGLAGSKSGKCSYWLCECECGEFVFISTTQLQRPDSKATKSCGCLHKGVNKTHGYSKTIIHKAWSDRKQRCFNPNSPDYPDYGGRGITMCERWLIFENFLEDVLAEIGESPSSRHTLDRVNNNGNYEPGNIKWSTPQEQARNRRSSKIITFRDTTLTLAAWAERIGVDQDTLGWRLLHGWSTERALTTPTQR